MPMNTSPPQLGFLITVDQASGSGVGYDGSGNIGCLPSGDLAFSTGGTLFMTAVKDNTTDKLVTIDLSPKAFPQPRCTVVGDIGQFEVNGLVSSLGELYGFTETGRLIRISKTTGTATVLATGGPQVYGAASPTQLN